MKQYITMIPLNWPFATTEQQDRSLPFASLSTESKTEATVIVTVIHTMISDSQSSITFIVATAVLGPPAGFL